MKEFLILLLIGSTFQLNSQVQDDFADGNFSAIPNWTGTDANFIVNGTSQLQLNASIAGNSYLSTPHNLSTFTNQEWRFYVKQSFAGSTSNFGRVYLSSTNADLSTNPDGIYLQFGEALATDAIRLISRVGGTNTELTSTAAGSIATTTNASIKIIYSVGTWNLYADLSGGTAYALLGTATVATAFTGTHTGMLCTYTLGNITKFYYDNIYVGAEIIDVLPPTVASIDIISANQLDVNFSEVILSSSIALTDFTGNNGLGNPTTATIDGTNPALIHLTFGTNFVNGTNYLLNTQSISDLAGNSSLAEQDPFVYLVNEIALKGDLIITEFFPDPSPVIGLPEYEFVEIYNRSTKFFNLTGWKIFDASASGTVVSGWISPGEYKVLCTSAALPFFTSAYGVTSFPSQNNTGDLIRIQNPLLVTIDEVNYTDAWYRDEIKKDGGYTLELINPNDPCAGADNWIASNAFIGGTPGSINSVYDVTPDTQIPLLTNTFVLPPSIIQIQFNEGMDSVSLANAIITISGGLTVASVSVSGNGTNTMNIFLNTQIQNGIFYTVTLANVADCWGNATTVIGNFANAFPVSSGDLIINEILFNPATGGSDFVEIYNKSDKLLDVFGLEFANFDNDTIDNQKLVTIHKFIKPGDYLVFSPDTLNVFNQYPTAVKGSFVQMALPSYNNDSSSVYLISGTNVLDKLSYLEDWHFQLLDNFDAKSLERIDAKATTQARTNWYTAAESVNFGTPGKINSQNLNTENKGDIALENSVVSPDNDGFEDLLRISYKMETPNMVGKIFIYSENGVKIRELYNNELLATSGILIWDGLTDSGTKASIGRYILQFEAFNIEGGAKVSKQLACVVAGKI